MGVGTYRVSKGAIEYESKSNGAERGWERDAYGRDENAEPKRICSDIRLLLSKLPLCAITSGGPSQ